MNPRSKLLVAAGLACACALAQGGTGGGWISVLKNTPAEAFEDDDLYMFLDTAKNVLDAQGAPEKVSWTNPATGAGGDFLVTAQSTGPAGAPCKRMRFHVYARNYKPMQVTWTACRNAEGKWRLSHMG
jgi:hypothetical protein